jgi:hypothetical protein
MTKQNKAVKGYLNSFGNLSINYTLVLSRRIAEVTFEFESNPDLELSFTPDIETEDNNHLETEVIESVNERSIALANSSGWLAFQHDEIHNMFVTSKLVHFRIKPGTSMYARLSEEIKRNDPETLKYI